MKVLVLLFFTIPVISLGQSICFDFEDHDLTGWIPSAEGRWCISEENAIEGSFSLKHCFDSDQAGTDRISVIHDPLSGGEAIWRFKVAHQFAPSANNSWAVMITANSIPDNNGSLACGLIIGVNYTGNSDEIRVWEANEGILSELLNTGINWQDRVVPGAAVGFELSAQSEGVYRLRINTSGEVWDESGDFQSHAIENPNIFSLWHKYTASYDQGLWLDDLCIEGYLTQDTLSPAISSIYLMSSCELEVELNEPVVCDQDAAWQIEGMTGIAQNASPTEKIEILLPDHLAPGKDYLLEHPRMSDLYGNTLAPGSCTIYYPRPYDLLICEIMADPTPVIGLPESEYLCILNTSMRELDIKGWSMNVNGRFRKLPIMHFRREEEIILLPEGKAEEFNGIWPTQEVVSFPSLNNSGAEIILSDASGTLIHSVQYESRWHEYGKREGGWSLEIMDPLEPCLEEGNWQSSEDPRGGTPGEINSVNQRYRGKAEPEFWRAAVTDSGTLEICFSEAMDSLSLINFEYYRVDHGIGHPVEVIPSWPQANKAKLKFTRAFVKGVRYEISLTSDLCDCSHNSLRYPHSRFFQISEEVFPGDLLINEILFDPEAGQIEFVELYNKTINRIDLKDFRLIVGAPQDSAALICSGHWPLDGEEYALIAESYTGIDNSERFRYPEKIIKMQGMPALPNSGSEIYLITPGDEICDAALYLPDYHHEVLTCTKGVSLERISPNQPGFSPGNWHSASSDAGFMTPGAPNSQTGPEQDCYIRVSPSTLTQNGMGTNDRLTIEYHLDKEGYMAQVYIFNIKGERKYTVAQGILLGANGRFEIEGSSLREAQMSTGYYIIFFNALHRDGSSFSKKVSFVLAR